jgi:hypothetical protein
VEAVLATLQSVALLARLQVMLKAGSAPGSASAAPRTHDTRYRSQFRDTLMGFVKWCVMTQQELMRIFLPLTFQMMR